ncbi:MAG: hypothetical protein AB1659_06740 [Thermodesulfobacteriota bacterium]
MLQPDTRERFIIHLNVTDFAVAVERAADIRLKRRPVIIAPEKALRATVYDMSEEAYQEGVHKGMLLRQALRRCPEAVVLSPHPDRYEQAMHDLLKHALPYSPVVEIADHQGHLFIDATGTGRLFGPPPDLAWRIRKRLRTSIGFDPIWSVAPNKLVAKVATRMVKPAGEYIVGSGEEEEFLKPIPIHMIPGIRPEDLKCFYDFNITRSGEASRLSMAQLHILFGNRSPFFYNAVRGIDPSPVVPFTRNTPLISAEHLFGDDTTDPLEVERVLFGLAQRIGLKLRRMRLTSRRIKIRIDYSDGYRAGRQISMNPSANDFTLFTAARTTLNGTWKRRIRIRLLHLGVDRLASPFPVQGSLFEESRKNIKESMIHAIDTIRRRFGSDAIQVGRVFQPTG